MTKTDARKEMRQRLATEGKFRLFQGSTEKVDVSDLSANGYRIDCSAFPVQVEIRALLRLDGFESFAGTVRWVENGAAGVEFDEPLHPAVVDHICRLNPIGRGTVEFAVAA